MLFVGVCRLLGGLLSVACGMYRYAFYVCVSIAWVVASIAYIRYISSLLFCAFAFLLVSLGILVSSHLVSFLGYCLIVGSLWKVSVACLIVGGLWNVSVCFL